MTWIFAILAVLVVGGVAVVASGRLGAMPEPERRAGGLLGRGTVVAADLRRVRFTPVLRGYRMSEVDELLDRLADQMEQAEVQAQPKAAPESGPSTASARQEPGRS